MFADSFSQPRRKLETALTDLFALAAECGLPTSKGPALKTLLEHLREPGFLTVAGGPGSGKSTLLAALFAAPVFAMTPSAAAALHRPGKSEKRAAEKGGVTEVTHAGAFPRDFLLAEWNTQSAAKTVTKDWLNHSETILFCLPVTQPWARASWDWLDDLSAEAWSKLVLVLTMADLRTAAELDAMAEHARGLCQAKHGAAPPLFIVSASLGLRARRASPPAARAGNGMEELEAGLLKILRAAPKRKTARESARTAGLALADRIQSNLEEADQALAAAAGQDAEKIATARAALESGLLAAAALGQAASGKWREFSAAEAAGLSLPGFPAMLWKTGSAADATEQRAADRLVAWLAEQGAPAACGLAARHAVSAAGGAAFWENRLAHRRRTAWFFAVLTLLAGSATAAALTAGAPLPRAILPGLLVAAFSGTLGWLVPRQELRELAVAKLARAEAAAPGIAAAVTLSASSHARALADARNAEAASPDGSAADTLHRRRATLEAATRALRESA